MSYITVRGNLGSSHTIVNGMDRQDLEQLAEYMHRGPKHEDTDAVTFFDPVMKVINQLEAMFGYEVISCNNLPTSQQRTLHHTDLTMWTMYRNEVRSHHHHGVHRRGSYDDE
ncbi:uncharacterized protein [Rhodnius prolixus]|uniref:uncharacterized protein n=1 Tax=Rhodnius prolixus TaxID=13249 RepID=UPI003D189299